jgi:hypothetical protein
MIIIIQFDFQKDLETREKSTNQPVHVINIDVCDNHEDATLGAFILLDLAQMVWPISHFKSKL